ncbi:hypothetical protein AB0J40_03365 [Amycolatopsis sp. NPDC049691]|uniref:hypothetical protein n=1 Tax=Amycolatopsis sp. NPDC049691 TaxID=3155155 RepID=UPI0034321FFE
MVGAGAVLYPSPLPRTTAFTDAGLPGAPFYDTTFTGLRWWILAGVVLVAVAVIGLIVTAVRSGGRRRRAAAAPPVR